MPADRGDRPARPRHPPIWSLEASGVERFTHGEDALCGCASTAGKLARGFLQPRGISKSFEVWRAGAGTAPDSRIGECPLSALRADPPKHVYQRADSAARDLANENA